MFYREGYLHSTIPNFYSLEVNVIFKKINLYMNTQICTCLIIF